MWRTGFFRLATFGGLLALGSSAAGAQQCRLCGVDEAGGREASAIVPMTVEVETSLDFDRLVLTGPSGGTARLGADGSRATSGGIAEFSGRAMVGSMVIRGEPGRAVRIDLPSRIELQGWNGASIVIERIGSDLPDSPRLDASGRLGFRFGGELSVQGDSEGEYRGDIPITVEYL